MYSMVLLASLATAGDAPAFGKKKADGGCTGAVATVGCTGGVAGPVVMVAPTGCQGSVVAAGCHGTTPAPAPRAGFLGICKKKKEAAKGCTGGAAPTGCQGTVVTYTVAAVPPPAPVVVAVAPTGCQGFVAAPAGCHGSAAAPAPKAGFLGLCKKKKEAAKGCTGGMAAPAGCFGSTPGVVVGGCR